MKRTFTQKFWANQSRKGFTLVELVMAIAILAVIAAIAIPVVSSVIKNANQNTDKNNGKTVDLIIKEAYTEFLAGISPDSYTKKTKVGEILEDKGAGNVFNYKTANYDVEDQIKFYYNDKGVIEAIQGTPDENVWHPLTANTELGTACGDPAN